MNLFKELKNDLFSIVDDAPDVVDDSSAVVDDAPDIIDDSLAVVNDTSDMGLFRVFCIRINCGPLAC